MLFSSILCSWSSNRYERSVAFGGMNSSVFSFRKAIPFADTDMAGVVHYSRLLRYAEEAEHALYAQLGIPICNQEIGWPRLHLEATYLAPVYFGDCLEIHLTLIQMGASSLSWKAAYLDEKTGSKKVEAAIRTCFVKRTVHGGFESEPIPEKWRSLLENWS